jgi:DNA polymerase III delta prime subunit
MDAEIPVHPATKQQLDKYLKSPAHAVILLGPAGSGKSVVARTIAAELLDEQYDRAVNQGRLAVAAVEENKSEISIDTIRQIIRQLSKKAQGKRAVMIENAGLMSQEAQNALLKTLEQPGADTYFILTASSQSAVLATISSRAVSMNIRPVSLDQAKEHYQEQFTEAEIEKAWQLSEGHAGILDALLKGERSEIIDMIELAKQFLRIKPYERLIELDNLAKDRQRMKLFLEALQRVLKAVHHNSIKSQQRSGRRLLEARKVVKAALEKLETNTSPKLIELDLVANLTV